MGAIPLSTLFPSVPSMAEEAQGFVESMLTDARTHAEDAFAEAQTAIADLKTPLLKVTIPEAPESPIVDTKFSATLNTAASSQPDLGKITVPEPSQAFTPDDITIPDITGTVGAYVPLITGFQLPNAPAPGTFVMPTPPAVETTFELDAAPTKDYGDIPDLFGLELPEFVAPTLAAFAFDAPTFDGDIAQSGVDWVEPAYVGQLATTLKATLATMLAGGTGIDALVERAIWERDRARLDVVGLAEKQKAAASWAGKGFNLPPGALLANQIAIDREGRDKIAQASRDVAIKQADLEQSNRQFAVKSGIELEQLYVQMFLATVQRSYDIARFAVEARIQIFNAQVAKFNVEQQVYAQRIAQYRVGLEYAQAQIAVYKAQIEAENVKAEINKSLIEAFKAKVAAFQAQADAYRSLVQAATARAEMQKNKVELFRAQIEGVVAQISAKKQEFDAFNSRVQGEVAKGQLEEANSRAYVARVTALTAAAGLSVKEAEVKIQNSQMKLQYAVANVNRIGTMAGQQLAVIQANASVYDANTRRAIADFEVKRGTKQLEITATTEANRNIIAKYVADIEVWKAKVAQIVQFVTLQVEAMKTAGQIAGTLAAGAAAGTSVSAAFNGSVGRSESTSQSQGYTESHSTADNTSSSNSTSTNTNFNHQLTS